MDIYSDVKLNTILCRYPAFCNFGENRRLDTLNLSHYYHFTQYHYVNFKDNPSSPVSPIRIVSETRHKMGQQPTKRPARTIPKNIMNENPQVAYVTSIHTRYQLRF